MTFIDNPELLKKQDSDDCCGEDEDLGNYITQVVTDIGTPWIPTDIVHKLNKVPKPHLDFKEKKLKWKMASVSNQEGVPQNEYSNFAMHVYRYLSYLKDVEPPTIEELQESGRMVDIEPTQGNSKSY